MAARRFTFALVLALGIAAGADGSRSVADAPAPKVVLRMATVAPSGTAWAHEIDAFARDVESGTHGDVKVKLYYNGVVGDEGGYEDRLKRGQIDGVLSGQMFCQRASPSMRIFREVGLIQSRDETSFLLGELDGTFRAEAEKRGFALLGTSGFGSEVMFTREPVHNLTELKKARLWRWDIDDLAILLSREMGLSIVPTPLYDAGKTYDAGKSDGFIAVPSAALAFQWFAQAQYVTDLRPGYIVGCVVLTSSAFDALPIEHQRAVREAAMKLAIRFDDVGRRQDDALMGGVFEKQGIKVVPISSAFRAEFFDAARAARVRLGEKVVPKALSDQVTALLADYRAEHEKGR